LLAVLRKSANLKRMMREHHMLINIHKNRKRSLNVIKIKNYLKNILLFLRKNDFFI